jgi:4-amino-4-deoxy-L-arabinose transferase-like glycosyltransferase
MDILMRYLPLFIPLIVVQAALAITALAHVVRHPHYRFGNMAAWVVIVLAVNTLGPIAYFVFGRGEEG